MVHHERAWVWLIQTGGDFVGLSNNHTGGKRVYEMTWNRKSVKIVAPGCLIWLSVNFGSGHNLVVHESEPSIALPRLCRGAFLGFLLSHLSAPLPLMFYSPLQK